MKIINLTPHAIKIINGKRLTTLLSKGTARVSIEEEEMEPIDGISIKRVSVGEIEGLPSPKEGTIFITSQIVAQQATNEGRKDVYHPHSLERDQYGAVIGCHGLAQPSPNKALASAYETIRRMQTEYNGIR